MRLCCDAEFASALRVTFDNLADIDADRRGSQAASGVHGACGWCDGVMAAPSAHATACDARDRISYRLAGVHVARVLKGKRPSELPVVQAIKIELFLNLKTAKAEEAHEEQAAA